MRGKGNVGYLDGSIPIPKKDFATYRSWEAENSVVMAWLINFMEPKIGRIYLYYKTTKDILQTVQVIYSNLENKAQRFESTLPFALTRQNTSNLTKYYNTLIELWQEMDLFYETNWHFPEDGINYNNMLERKRVFDILQGLNTNLDEVRDRLLVPSPCHQSKKPLLK